MDQKVGGAADQAYAYMRERLIAGDFAAGTRLTEWMIADELGTSRTPVREAMRRLVGDGFLQVRRNYGTFVCSWSTKEIDELFNLRALLESEIAGVAAGRISAAQIERLSTLQAQIEERGADLERDNLARIAALNRDFHLVIADASGSARMVGVLTNAIEAPVVQQTFRRYDGAQLQRSFHHHRELIDAFSAGDSAWAQAAMSCHVRAARFAMLGEETRRG